MSRPARRVLAASGWGLALAVWSVLLPDGVDAWWPWAPPAVGSWLGAAAQIVAHVTQPAIAYSVLIAGAVWSFRRRLRVLSATLLLASALTVSIVTVLKSGVSRARPETPWLGILSEDASYPSGHVAGAVALALGVGLVLQAARVSARRRRVAVACGVAWVLLVAADRLVLNVHHVSDVIGAVLAALFATNLAACLTGLDGAGVTPSAPRRVAVIFNPAKVGDEALLRRLVSAELAERGWGEASWHATTVADPGRGMARAALALSADLVLVAGGDGTVRTVCGELAGSGIAVGLLPSGTGNLLALNLELPFDAQEALRVALDGEPASIDLIRVELPGAPAQFGAVIVGAGADAAVLGDSEEQLKRILGPAAYVIAGLRHVTARPVRTRVAVDASAPIERDASLVEVGNVGRLQSGVALMPAADASDGLLDVLIASPSNTAEVAQLMAGVLAGSDPEPLLDRARGRRVEVSLAEPAPCQIDGDVIGDWQGFACEVVPGAARIQLG